MSDALTQAIVLLVLAFVVPTAIVIAFNALTEHLLAASHTDTKSKVDDAVVIVN